MKAAPFVLFFLVGLLAVAAGAHAATLTVTNEFDSGDGSLRNVLENATDDANTITFAGNVHVIETKSKLVIQHNVTIDGDWQVTIQKDPGSGNFFGIQVDADVILHDLWIRNFTLHGAQVNAGHSLTSHANFTGNSATRGGGVFVDGEFTNHGNVTGNTANDDGGGVYVSTSGSFTNHGNVTGNTANDYAGGVFVSGGSFTNHGDVTGNSAAFQGGGVYVSTSGSFTNHGNVTGNSAAVHGGGVVVSGSGSFANHGDVSGNSADFDGGGVFIEAVGSFTNHGNVTGNTAAASRGGGGVFVLSGLFTNHGNVTGNTANDDGGGVYVSTSGSFTNQGTITHNHATNGDGGGIYIRNGAPWFNITGTITDNTASGNGGGIWADAKGSIYQATIHDNTANGDFDNIHRGTSARTQGNVTSPNPNQLRVNDTDLSASTTYRVDLYQATDCGGGLGDIGATQWITGTLVTTNATGAYNHTFTGLAKGLYTTQFHDLANGDIDRSHLFSDCLEIVNNAPVATAGTLSVTKNVDQTGQLAGTDVDGDVIESYALVDSPSNGTVVLNTTLGNYTYSPGPDFIGTVSFNFTVNDGELESAPAKITITVSEAPLPAPTSSGGGGGGGGGGRPAAPVGDGTPGSPLTASFAPGAPASFEVGDAKVSVTLGEDSTLRSATVTFYELPAEDAGTHGFSAAGYGFDMDIQGLQDDDSAMVSITIPLDRLPDGESFQLEHAGPDGIEIVDASFTMTEEGLVVTFDTGQLDSFSPFQVSAVALATGPGDLGPDASTGGTFVLTDSPLFWPGLGLLAVGLAAGAWTVAPRLRRGHQEGIPSARDQRPERPSRHEEREAAKKAKEAARQEVLDAKEAERREQAEAKEAARIRAQQEREAAVKAREEAHAKAIHEREQAKQAAKEAMLQEKLDAKEAARLAIIEEKERKQNARDAAKQERLEAKKRVAEEREAARQAAIEAREAAKQEREQAKQAAKEVKEAARQEKLDVKAAERRERAETKEAARIRAQQEREAAVKAREDARSKAIHEREQAQQAAKEAKEAARQEKLDAKEAARLAVIEEKERKENARDAAKQEREQAKQAAKEAKEAARIRAQQEQEAAVKAREDARAKAIHEQEQKLEAALREKQQLRDERVAALEAKEAERRRQAERCTATTKAGTQCTNRAKVIGGFCQVHDRPAAPQVQADGRCQAMTPIGLRCSEMLPAGHTHCKKHRQR